jgi:hypothetical protein
MLFHRLLRVLGAGSPTPAGPSESPEHFGGTAADGARAARGKVRSRDRARRREAARPGAHRVFRDPGPVGTAGGGGNTPAGGRTGQQGQLQGTGRHGSRCSGTAASQTAGTGRTVGDGGARPPVRRRRHRTVAVALRISQRPTTAAGRTGRRWTLGSRSRNGPFGGRSGGAGTHATSVAGGAAPTGSLLGETPPPLFAGGGKPNPMGVCG